MCAVDYPESSTTMGCTTSSVSPANLEKVLLANNKPAALPNINAESSSLNSSSSTKDALIYTEAVDNSGNLFAAIKRGDLEASKTLIESMQTTKLAARAQPIVINQLIGMWNATPLIVAAQYGQKEIALELLKLSELGNLNHVNDKGASVLLYACMEGLVEIVSFLSSNASF